MNLIHVARELAIDEQCLVFLEKQRWPDGIVRCPTCSNDQISRIHSQSIGSDEEQASAGLLVPRGNLEL
jgi:hypothetical protein